MTREELLQAAAEFAAQNERSIVRDIKRLVDIKSVRGEAAPGAPFGTGPRRALDEGIAIARELGLTATVEDDVMGVAEVAGTSGKAVGIIAHVDVVPEGNGWDSDPFGMIEKEGYLIGRGVADDKGPAVLGLYAAKFFAQQAAKTGTAPRHTVRVLLGSDEESGMGDVPCYLANHAAPDFTFSPDGSFPVCNGEKGLYGASFVSPALNGVLHHIEGGVAHNVVPDRAFAVLKGLCAAQLPAAEGLTFTDCAEGVRVDATGKGGHASLPEGTINAIGRICDYLLNHDLTKGEEKAYLELLHDLFAAPDGSLLGIASDDGLFTPLTIIGGTISMADGVITQTMDCRFPTSTNIETLNTTLHAKAAAHGATLVEGSCDAPFYIEPDSAPIQALLCAYNEVTAQQEKPFVMGGGTYARHMPNAVSFGIEEEKEVFPDFVGPIHGANEGFSLARLMRALQIYIVALWDLMEIDL